MKGRREDLSCGFYVVQEPHLRTEAQQYLQGAGPRRWKPLEEVTERKLGMKKEPRKINV